MQRSPLFSILISSFAMSLQAQWDFPTPETLKPPGNDQVAAAAPQSYPDREGFLRRSRLVAQGVSEAGLQKWREGYFSGGDPGKYLPGHAMAKLLINANDPEPVKFMNDSRSYKEHYHFAAVNWGRFLPIFGEKVLTPETQKKLADAAFNYGAYYHNGGTDNHRTMWWTTGSVIPHYLVGGKGLSHRSKKETLRIFKGELKNYVKGLYMAGQGEWDSNIYIIFTVNGLLNIYDFSPDPETRLLARAGLDWLIASYAQKYRNGIFAGPHQRGFPEAPYQSLTDQTGFLWWGNAEGLTPHDVRHWRYTLHAMTSGWRPNRVITNIAEKKGLPFPIEQRNSKPNYWHGSGKPWKAGQSHESVYITKHVTMGSLWDQHSSQHSRFNIVTDDHSIFSGGHTTKSDHRGKLDGKGYQDGTGRYLQSAQVGPLYMAFAKWPDDGKHDPFTFFSYPENLTPTPYGVWRVFRTENAVIAVRPISKTNVTETGRIKKDKATVKGLLKFPSDDAQSGFLVWVDPPSLQALDAVQVDYRPTQSAFHIQAMSLKLDFEFSPHPNGYTHGSKAAKVSINGKAVDFSDWDIYTGPLLEQTPGVLTVSDGKESFTVDFTGDLPVYRR